MIKTTKLLMVLISGILLFSTCSKDSDKRISSEEFYKDAFRYEGAFPEIEEIHLTEDGTEYIIPGFPGQMVVYFKDGVSVEKARQVIEMNGGKILEQIPYIQYYLVETEAKKEQEFIEKLSSEETEYVYVNFAVRPFARVSIVDQFTKESHGYKVAHVFSSCSGKQNVKQKDIYRSKENGVGENAIIDEISNVFGDAASSDDSELINLSFGPDLTPGKRWAESTEKTQASLVKTWQKHLKGVIKNLRKVNKKNKKDYVITIAAGNAGMPDLYEYVIKPLEKKLSTSELEILEKNVLIVSSLHEKVNKSSRHNSFAYVDIKGVTYPDYETGEEKQLEGSSFAAPKALCNIEQAMGFQKKNGKNLTAVEALALVKEAVKKDPHGALYVESMKSLAKEKGYIIPGELDLEDTNFANTKWSVDLKGQIKTIVTGPEYNDSRTTPVKDNGVVFQFTKDALIANLPGNIEGVSFSQSVNVKNKNKIELTITAKNATIDFSQKYTFEIDPKNSKKLTGNFEGGHTLRAGDAMTSVTLNGTFAGSKL